MSAPLMVSISGIRGIAHQSFTQEVIEKYTTAFGKIVADANHPNRTIIVGRDSRMSGMDRIVVSANSKVNGHSISLSNA
jgi:phosphomannomutase